MTVNHILSDLSFSSELRIRDQALEALTRRITESAVGTRQALAPFLVTADPYQEAVIASSACTIRMVAPAGAGKTQTIINRVLRRVQGSLNPARILVLTFDNAAVNSIKIKLRQKLAAVGVELSGLRIHTLNAYGYSVLKDRFRSEYKQVVEPRRQYGIIKELRNQLRSHSSEHFEALPEYLANRYYLESFSLLKNNLFDPRSVDAQVMTDFLIEAPQITPFFRNPASRESVAKTIEAIIWLYQGYDRLLQRDRFLDFDDQKLRTYLLLTQHSAVLSALQNQLDEVIVDEFQDINRLDFVLVEAVAKKAVLLVTGDDDQAIYGFRGCTPDFIIDLKQRLGRPLESHELQINYRCPPVIVEHADRLIKHNIRRIPKTPRAHSDVQAQIHVVSSLSAGIEAKSIVSLINRVKSEVPALGYNDFTVLYRTNAQSLPLQVQFIRNAIPYYVRPEHNILQNESLGKLLSILRVKLALGENAQPLVKDSVSTICSFFRYVDPKVLPKLEAEFRQGGDFLDKVHSEKVRLLLPAAGRDILPAAMREMLAADSLLQTLDIIAERFYGVYGMIGGLEDVVQDRVPLGEVYEIALEFPGGVKEFVQTLDDARERARTSKAGQDHKTGVPLLTYFRSKGLQWHTVILTTCNEGLIPHHKAPVEEERRLFYVAMTRASSNLVVSYVQNACGCQVQPSRFLYEAGLLSRRDKPRRTRRPKNAQPCKSAPAAARSSSLSDGYVASANSIVFHCTNCAAAKKIKENTLVRYNTRDEAIRAKRHPCGVCRP